MNENLESDSLLCYLNFILIGFCFISPWNSVLASIYYFKEQFPNIKIEFYLTFPCYIAVFIFSLLIFPISSKFVFKHRIYASLFFLIISLILLPIFSELLHNYLGFWLFMFLIFFENACTTIMQTSIFGIGTMLSYKLISSINVGTGFSSIFSSILSIVFLAFLKNEYFLITMICFSLTVGFISIEIILFYYLSKKKGFKDIFNEKRKLKIDLLNEEDNTTVRKSYLLFNENEEIINDDVNKNSIKTSQILNFSGDMKSLLKKLIKKSWHIYLLIFVNYIQTFSVFPGIIFNKKFSFVDNIAWSNALTFLFFNIFDTFGKYIGVFRKFSSMKIVITLIILRILLVFVSVDKYLIDFDWIFITNIILIGFTNGFLTTKLMILASENFSYVIEKEFSGFLACFMLNLGCIVGSFIAILFDYLFQISSK